MKRITNLLMLGAMFLLSTSFIRADEPAPSVRAVAAQNAAPNAAGIYWHAFAAFPSLNDEEKKLLRTAMPNVAAPLPDELEPIVSRYGRAMHELHRARTVVPCDWQLDMAAGPELIVPHLDKTVELSRVALLRARQRFSAGETDAALSDLLAVFKLARDGGSSPLVISMFVDAAIEKSATDVLAAHLTQLSADQIRHFTGVLRELPQNSDSASMILQDERISCDWLVREFDTEIARLKEPKLAGQALLTIISPLNFRGGPGPSVEEAAEEKRRADILKSLSFADVQESFHRLRTIYAEIHKIAGLPFTERAERIRPLVKSFTLTSKMETREDAVRYICMVMMPFDWNDVFTREEQMHVRRQLLDQALSVQVDGVDAMQEIYGKKVEYRKTAVGFELSCLVGDKPEILSVAGSK